MVRQAMVPEVLPADQDRALSALPSDGEEEHLTQRPVPPEEPLTAPRRPQSTTAEDTCSQPGNYEDVPDHGSNSQSPSPDSHTVNATGLLWKVMSV